MMDQNERRALLRSAVIASKAIANVNKLSVDFDRDAVKIARPPNLNRNSTTDEILAGIKDYAKLCACLACNIRADSLGENGILLDKLVTALDMVFEKVGFWKVIELASEGECDANHD